MDWCMVNNNKSVKKPELSQSDSSGRQIYSVSALEKVNQQTNRAGKKGQQQPQHSACLTACIEADKPQCYRLKGKGTHYISC